jgi:hypothetical protein
LAICNEVLDEISEEFLISSDQDTVARVASIVIECFAKSSEIPPNLSCSLQQHRKAQLEADSVDTVSRELGRKKLMMKLPDLRNQLRDASGDGIDELMVAYQLAVSARDRIRAHKEAPLEWSTEYDILFDELENIVRRYFAHHRPKR